MVGHVGVGGANPVRVQSMITCDTMDTEASIAQSIELAEVGCEIVRITAPTVKDAANLQHIVRGLRARGCEVPIVADIHFKPEAALEAAKWVEKVRINPGNYADSKKFKIIEYTDEQYAAELQRIRERFTPLVRLCLERGIAMRIGTNHGSLSDRIMNRYGDTPLGMVESALEFARIARDLDYHALIFSMKSSNPKVMIAAYRLLVARLREEGADWNYPIHLGVTEAGEGEDARIKSAIGIGSLLRDGIGDTIRVSLTEDSIHEIPVARALIETTKSESGLRSVAARNAIVRSFLRSLFLSAPCLEADCCNGGLGRSTTSLIRSVASVARRRCGSRSGRRISKRSRTSSNEWVITNQNSSTKPPGLSSSTRAMTRGSLTSTGVKRQSW